MPPPLPHSIVGYVYSYDGSTAIASAIVEAQHTTTLEKQTVIAAIDGYFLIECANFPSGYTAGDSIALIAFIPTREAKSNLTSVTIDANPSQSQNMTITETLRAVESCLQPAYDAHAKALKFVQVFGDGSYKAAESGTGTDVNVTNASIPVTAASLPLPSGASTSALQLPDGHNITVDNAAAGSAVNIQDGGNTITVDGTVAVTGTFWQATQPVSGTFYQVTQPVSGTVTAELGVTDNAVIDDIAANQTDASQKTQVVDGSGNVIGATANALDVNIKSGGAGNGCVLDGVDTGIKATVLDYTNSNPVAVRLTDTDGSYVGAGAGTQYTEGDTDATITGTAMLWEDGSNTLVTVNASKPLPVDITDASVAVTNAGITTIAGAVTGTEMQCDVITMPVTHVIADSGTITAVTTITNAVAVTNAAITSIDGKMVSGTDIGDVTVNNAGSVSAVNIQDGGNTITVDGTITADLSATDNAVLDAIDTAIDAINAKLVTGTDIGDVTINNSTGAAAVNIQDGGNTITVDGTVAVTNADITSCKTALELIDNSVDGNYLNVNLNAAGTDLAMNAGVNSAQTLRVTIATDDECNNFLGTIDADTSTLSGAVSGSEMQVDVVTMPVAHIIADSGTITTVTGITNAVAVTNAAITSIDGKMVTGTDIGDVTINNSTGAAAVNIQDGGNAITVDGTVAVTNADITSCKTALELIDNSVDGAYLNVNANIAGTDFVGGAGAVAAGVQRVTLASDDPAVASLSVLDDWDSGDTCKVTAQAGTAAIGKLLPPDIDITGHANYIKKYYTNAGAVTDGIIWSSAAGKRWHVVTLYINVSAAATVTLEDDLAGGDSAVFKSEFAANSGVAIHFGEMYPLASGEDASDLLVTSTAGNIYITAVGYEC